MELIVRIGSDPTSWVVPGASYESLIEQLSKASAPVVVPVMGPLDGSLVVSHRAAASVALIQPPGGTVLQTRDWNPGHEGAPTAPLVYLASPGGPGQGGQYVVSSNVDRATAVQDIVTAMKDGKVLSFDVFDSTGTGVLLINGAALPFAVVS